MNHALVRYNTYEHFVESLFTLSFSMLQSNYTKSKKGADTASTFPKGDDKAERGAMDPVSAALIIADKTDVRRSRVREQQKSTFDIHDRVNYAVTKSNLIYSSENKAFTLDLKLDTDICTMYEYFEIFLNRMMMCRGAAELLGVKFELTANGSKIL